METGTLSSSVSGSRSPFLEFAGPCAGRVQSIFKINEVKGLLQERFEFHSIQIFSYSLEIIFRKNNRSGLGSNELELFNKRGAIRIRKMIFKNHNMRSNFLSKMKGLTRC